MQITIWDVKKKVEALGFGLEVLSPAEFMVTDPDKSESPVMLWGDEIFQMVGGNDSDLLNTLTAETLRKHVSKVILESKLKVRNE